VPADPLDPGAVATAAVTLTASQLRQLVDAISGHAGSVRIEAISAGYARVVLIGPEGAEVAERSLFPV
jgi:hypothetical protein